MCFSDMRAEPMSLCGGQLLAGLIEWRTPHLRDVPAASNADASRIMEHAGRIYENWFSISVNEPIVAEGELDTACPPL
jgi:hypothetical protein